MTAGSLLRNARLAAGATQADLAAASRHLQPAISRIERRGGASFDTVEHLLRALGLRLIAVPLSRPTVADYASEIRNRIGGDLPVTRVLAEATNTLIEAGPHDLALLVATPPALTTEVRVDAFLAGLVEHVCGTGAPVWTHQPARFTTTDWVLNPFTNDKVLEALIRSATPAAFARHGVYVDVSDLASV